MRASHCSGVCGATFLALSAAQRHHQQRHDVDDLDQRVDRRAGGVLVGVAHGVAGDRRLVGLGALAAVVAFFDVLLGVVPRAAAGAHRDRHEQAGHDRAHQQAAERLRPEEQADR
jgi:hypothetical protein